jgi:hypothetical protein
VSLLLRNSIRAIALILVAANTLVVLEVTAHESVLVRVLAHAQASNSDAVQGVHVIVGGARVLGVGLLGTRSSRDWAGRTSIRDGGSGHGKVMTGLAQVNVWGKVGDVNGGVNQAALHGDDVITEGVVLMKEVLELLPKSFNTLVLSLQLADVGFLALAESALSRTISLCV